MYEHFRALAVHQAQFHKVHLEAWGASPSPAVIESLFEGLIYDGLWLTKFPLLFTPGYGVTRLAALDKARMAGKQGTSVTSEVLQLRPLVDRDMVKFLLALKPADLEKQVEIFFGGRAMNKSLWKYLAVWFEHGAVLRGSLSGTPGMLDTVFE
jgi:hypothetical protein